MSIKNYLRQGAELLRKTAASHMPDRLQHAISICVESLRNGHALLVCGNGGSAADSMHIAGELVGRFLKKRKAYRCICLASNPVVLTALGNDFTFDEIFARQVEAYGERGGVLIGLSTSGNSKNVILAFKKAKALGLTTIGFTGKTGGKMARFTDILIDVPSTLTPAIQQVHTHLYHYFCGELEKRLESFIDRSSRGLDLQRVQRIKDRVNNFLSHRHDI